MQIENEYQNVEKAYHGDGPPYVIWAANMAVALRTGVPWVMCKQDDAPDPVVASSYPENRVINIFTISRRLYHKNYNTRTYQL